MSIQFKVLKIFHLSVLQLTGRIENKTTVQSFYCICSKQILNNCEMIYYLIAFGLCRKLNYRMKLFPCISYHIKSYHAFNKLSWASLPLPLIFLTCIHVILLVHETLMVITRFWLCQMNRDKKKQYYTIPYYNIYYTILL